MVSPASERRAACCKASVHLTEAGAEAASRAELVARPPNPPAARLAFFRPTLVLRRRAGPGCAGALAPGARSLYPLVCAAPAQRCVPALLARSWVPKSIIARRPVQLSSGHQNSASSAMIERGCCRGALATYAAVAPEQRTAAQRAALSKCWPNSPAPHRPRGNQRPTAAPADETSVRSSAVQSRAFVYVVLRMTE